MLKGRGPTTITMDSLGMIGLHLLRTTFLAGGRSYLFDVISAHAFSVPFAILFRCLAAPTLTPQRSKGFEDCGCIFNRSTCIYDASKCHLRIIIITFLGCNFVFCHHDYL